MKVIAVAGEPGSGKSTLMRTVFPERGQAFRFRTLRGELFGDVARLGVYDGHETFPGTDRLSMAVQPDVVRFTEQSARTGRPRVIVFEGDRLSNSSLLVALRAFPCDLRVVVLRTAPRIVERRRVERGDTFSDAWLRGRVTKVENFERAARSLCPVDVLASNSYDDLVSNAEHLSRLVFAE